MKTILLLASLLVLVFNLSAQCPDFDHSTSWYFSEEHCGNPQLAVTDCVGNSQTNFTSVLFSTNGEDETVIEVVGSTYYTFNFTGYLWSHLLLYDGCGGDLIWGTFSCAPWDLAAWSTGVVPGSMAPSYTVGLNLPEGEYLLLFGYLGIPQVQNLMDGCVSVSIGAQPFLEIDDCEPLVEIENNPEVYDQFPKKIMHPVHGLLVIMPDGRAINTLFQQVKL